MSSRTTTFLFALAFVATAACGGVVDTSPFTSSDPPTANAPHEAGPGAREADVDYGETTPPDPAWETGAYPTYETGIDPDADAPPWMPPPEPPFRDVPTGPAPQPSSTTPTTPFEVLRDGMVGRWVGSATNANAYPSSWTLWLELYADGHYRVGCLTPWPCVGFQAGDDADDAKKSYVLYDLLADGEGEADIDITWYQGTEVTRGQLHRVALSTDQNTLTFEYLKTWLSSADPVKFSFHRAP